MKINQTGRAGEIPPFSYSDPALPRFSSRSRAVQRNGAKRPCANRRYQRNASANTYTTTRQ
jgi:hypothetical protein